jgi:hypothetical protein
MLLGVAQRLRSVVGLTDYLLHKSIRLHPRSLLETTIPKSKNGSAANLAPGAPPLCQVGLRISSCDTITDERIRFQRNWFPAFAALQGLP